MNTPSRIPVSDKFSSVLLLSCSSASNMSKVWSTCDYIMHHHTHAVRKYVDAAVFNGYHYYLHAGLCSIQQLVAYAIRFLQGLHSFSSSFLVYKC